MRPVGSYRALLAGNASFRRLFAVHAISILGDWFNTIALLGLVYGNTGSPLLIGLLFICEALPALVLAPFIGGVVDRCDKRRLMVSADLARAVLVLGYLLAARWLPVVFVIRVVMSVCSGLFNPARQAALPVIARREQLLTANALMTTAWGVIAVIGAALGGLLAATLGREVAFVLNSASFVISAVLVSRVAIAPARDADAGQRGEPLAGQRVTGTAAARFILREPVVLGLIAAGLSWGVVGGAYHLLVPVFSADVFRAGDSGLGVLYASQGLGVVAGSWVVGRYLSGAARAMKIAFGVAYVGQGLSFMLFANAGSLLTGAAILVVMRAFGGVIMALDTTLMQLHTPASMLGRVFAIHYALFGAVTQMSMLATGLLLRGFSPAQVGSAFGAFCLPVALTWFALMAKSGSSLDSARPESTAG
ncbi:MAG: MFS transporter [Candidatus Schekmanbacteria bacterium]|nr:MFS transporter [Candidatus Schekmanbacteria bacterium]